MEWCLFSGEVLMGPSDQDVPFANVQLQKGFLLVHFTWMKQKLLTMSTDNLQTM